MALSQQDLVCGMLLGRSGYYVDIGAGNGEGEPCASNTAWLEEVGWTGMLIEYMPNYCQEACRFRPKSLVVQANAFTLDYKKVFEELKVPKVIDYLTIDIDPTPQIQDPNTNVLSKFPFDEYDFKFLTIEHDLYNPHGLFQKASLDNYMKDKPYKMIVENVALAFAGKKYLEDWYINPKYYNDYLVKDVENLYYKEINPNDIVLDLAKRLK